MLFDSVLLARAMFAQGFERRERASDEKEKSRVGTGVWCRSRCRQIIQPDQPVGNVEQAT